MSRIVSTAFLAALSLPLALAGAAHAADLDYGYDEPRQAYGEPRQAYDAPPPPPPVVPRPVIYPSPVVYPAPLVYPRPFYRPLYPRVAFGYGPRFGRPWGYGRLGFRRF